MLYDREVSIGVFVDLRSAPENAGHLLVDITDGFLHSSSSELNF